MLKAVPGHPADAAPLPRKRRRLAAVAMLPTMLTLGNLILGFAAIYQCALEMHDLGQGVPPAAKKTLESVFFETRAPSHLSVAVWLLIAAMICDALDGRIARLAKKASKFGEQIDSLADVVSFGVAPAMMMMTLMRREVEHMGLEPGPMHHVLRLTALVGVVYTCCAALRLARFNVETSLDESAHRGFKGLPSPGAAGAVISVILLHEHLQFAAMWGRTAGALTRVYPFLTLAIGLLMVSRIPYTHVVSALLGRRPFGHVVVVAVVLPFLIMYCEQTLFIYAWVFVLSGPVKILLKRLKGPIQPVTAAGPPASQIEKSPSKSPKEA